MLVASIEKLVVASLPLPSGPLSPHDIGDMQSAATLPGAPGGLILGVGGRLLVAQPVDHAPPSWRNAVSPSGAEQQYPSLASGTARAKIGAAAQSYPITKRDAGRLLRAFYELGHR